MKLLDIERIIYNGKKVNIPRRHNDAKYVHDKQQSCKICKVELIEVKIDGSTIITGDFTYSFNNQ